MTNAAPRSPSPAGARTVAGALGSGITKRSVMIAGHRTSVSLEAPFWEALREIAVGRAQSVQALVGTIDAARGRQNLSSAIRVFVLASLRDSAATGHPSPVPDTDQTA